MLQGNQSGPCLVDGHQVFDSGIDIRENAFQKIYPGIPGQAKTDAMVGPRDKLLVTQWQPICKTRSLSDLGYNPSVHIDK